jgi:hypothetical protein
VNAHTLHWLGTLATLAATACSEPSHGEDVCAPDDADGLVGGEYRFEVSVDDLAFSPVILKAQNDAWVTLTLTNTGTAPHNWVVDCIPTPNDNGCPTEGCFPTEAKLAATLPGDSATVTFLTPLPEGIYEFRSDLPGDTQSGQFILQ